MNPLQKVVASLIVGALLGHESMHYYTLDFDELPDHVETTPQLPWNTNIIVPSGALRISVGDEVPVKDHVAAAVI